MKFNIFLVILVIACLANPIILYAQQEEELTLSTYYPAIIGRALSRCEGDGGVVQIGDCVIVPLSEGRFKIRREGDTNPNVTIRRTAYIY